MPEDSNAFLRKLARAPDRAPPKKTSREGEKMGRFELGEELGRGGMGVVHAARDESLGRRVAIKVLTPGADESEEQRKRFLREARSASAIRHANVATIHEVGEHEGELFVVMELVEGRSLRRLLAEGKPELAEVLRIARAIAQGIGAAHDAGVVHRDLKPENVMLEPEGAVKLLDFGLAKQTPQAREAMPSDDLVTEQGLLVGTPHYMSPEQAVGAEVDARSDVFSLGVMLYEMLSGERPFDGATPAATIIAASRDEPAPLHKRSPDVPRKLSDVVARMLSKRREERYADGDAVVEAIRAAMTPARQWPRWGAVAVAGALVAGLAAASSSPQRAHFEHTPARKTTTSMWRARVVAPWPSFSASSSTSAPRPSPAEPHVSTPAAPLDPLADQK